MNTIRPVARLTSSAPSAASAPSTTAARPGIHSGARSAPATSPAGASLHIERLLIRGVSLPAGSATRLEAAFRVELQHLARTSPLSHTQLASIALAALRLDPIRIDPAGGAEQLGRTLAQALWGGLAP